MKRIAVFVVMFALACGTVDAKKAPPRMKAEAMTCNVGQVKAFVLSIETKTKFDQDLVDQAWTALQLEAVVVDRTPCPATAMRATLEAGPGAPLAKFIKGPKKIEAVSPVEIRAMARYLREHGLNQESF